MGYLPQFGNDLFISYRRAANESHDRWIDAFCEALRASLTELVGNVSIWRDEAQLQGGDAWRPEIARALDNAAIFLAIISRTYFDSDECRKELDQFLGRLKDPASGAQRKIVPIFKQPPKPDQELPQELSNLHRHEFFHWDPPGSHRFRELGPGGDSAEAREFWETLGRVAQDLMVALEELRGSARRQALGKVFVARVGPELQLERERLRADLQQRGYLVVPEREILWNADDHRDKITRDLDGALLCIHLVARTASIEPNAAARARAQLELAHQSCKARGVAAPMVWIQPASQTDASAQALLDYIQNDLANEGVEYSQGGLEDFKTQVYDKLPKAPPAPSTPSAPGGQAAAAQPVALLVEEGDVVALGPLKAALVDGLGIEPRTVKFSGAVPKEAERLARVLAECRIGLVFWGRQSEEWLQDLLAHPALAQHLGRERLGVCIAAPASDEKAVFRTTKAQLIPALDATGLAQLKAFIAGAGAAP